MGTVVLLQAALEAEEEDGPGEDVEEEGEADPEGCEEHGADGVTAPGGEIKFETDENTYSIQP